MVIVFWAIACWAARKSRVTTSQSEHKSDCVSDENPPSLLSCADCWGLFSCTANVIRQSHSLWLLPESGIIIRGVFVGGKERLSLFRTIFCVFSSEFQSYLTGT